MILGILLFFLKYKTHLRNQLRYIPMYVYKLRHTGTNIFCKILCVVFWGHYLYQLVFFIQFIL